MEENQTQEAEQKPVVVRGEKGVVGKATAGQSIKQRWHSHALLRLSLKEYARGLAKTGDQDAKDWFDHKKGVLNQKRSDKNAQEAKAACAATKLKRRAKKGDNK